MLELSSRSLEKSDHFMNKTRNILPSRICKAIAVMNHAVADNRTTAGMPFQAMLTVRLPRLALN
jgi:hypothetical protein